MTAKGIRSRESGSGNQKRNNRLVRKASEALIPMTGRALGRKKSIPMTAERARRFGESLSESIQYQ